MNIIKYISGHGVAADGTFAPRPNAICIQEIDYSIQWKLDIEPQRLSLYKRGRLFSNRSSPWPTTSTSSRGLLISLVRSHLRPGQLEFARPTIAKDSKVPWGTTVADRVMAPYHQHLFDVRIDRAIGSYSNSFVYSDSLQMPWDDKLNPLGAGYVTKESMVNRAGPVEDSLEDGRVFNIGNHNVESVRNSPSDKAGANPLADASGSARLLVPATVRVRGVTHLGYEVKESSTVPSRRLHESITWRSWNKVLGQEPQLRCQRRHRHLA